MHVTDAQFRVPSGDLLTYECGLDLLVDHISTSIAFASRTDRRGFTAGTSGHFDSLLSDPDLGEGSVQYKVPWSDALTWQVATYESSPGLFLVGLIGREYELTHTFAGAELGRSAMESYFADFHFVETSRGMKVEAPAEYTYMGEMTVLAVRGGGVLAIPDGQSAVGLIPKSAGAETESGGEIWIESEDSDGLRLVLGFDSAVARCMVRGDPRERQRALDWLDRTRLSWTFAA